MAGKIAQESGPRHLGLDSPRKIAHSAAMPELPEVETTRRGLVAALKGRRLARVAASGLPLRRPLPPDLGARLAGRRVLGLDRRGKYLLMTVEAAPVLIAHLGMSGRMVVGAADGAPPDRHDHVVLETEDGVRVSYRDPRRFGLMVFAEGEPRHHPLLAGMGPEPLDDAFDARHLLAALAGRRAPVKAPLLDQRVVAGLGNIYVNEALYRAGISPLRPAGRVTPAEAARLVAAIKAVLVEAIAAGGSSLRDFARPDGELGYFSKAFAVYGRAGAPCPDCRCDAAATGGVRRVVQAGRSSFYCAERQR